MLSYRRETELQGQWQREGVRGGAVALGGHLQGRHQRFSTLASYLITSYDNTNGTPTDFE